MDSVETVKLLGTMNEISMRIQVSCDVTPSRLVNIRSYERFGEAKCLHLYAQAVKMGEEGRKVKSA